MNLHVDGIALRCNPFLHLHAPCFLLCDCPRVLIDFYFPLNILFETQ
jgi:hypothetical protein